MSNQSDTPETDGEWNRLACLEGPAFERQLFAFARKLERQLNEAIREVERWKRNFCAFAIIHSMEYGSKHYGEGCLHYTHYDLLEEAGARMDDFERCGEPEQPRHIYHSPACQLGDKCQCDEPEMEMSRQDIEDMRGDYEYQLMKDREVEDE